MGGTLTLRSSKIGDIDDRCGLASLTLFELETRRIYMHFAGVLDIRELANVEMLKGRQNEILLVHLDSTSIHLKSSAAAAADTWASGGGKVVKYE
ncbi:unnamed protein product [Brugia pahangi]|uniref:Transposase n=1 Tax=Brugia pahangi TaxID=6280 RepID=A0A158PQ72_BRUPA|nr:unnamed protein product [Brugia pahangi]